MLFNAVPLLLLAALYLAVGVTIAPAAWRERDRMREIGFATALVFPCVGLAAGILGLEVLVDRDPLAGHALGSFPAILVAALPLIVVARNWGDRGLLVAGARRAREAEQYSTLRDRELAAIGRLSHKLLDADKPAEVAVALLDELAELFELDVANLALVEESARRAVVVAARDGGEDNELLIGQEVALDREASGISTVVREGTAFAIFDAESSEVVNRRLNEIAKVKSCAFVPVRAGDRVVGVVFAAVRHPRLFDEDELATMQTFASEAGLALERTRLLGESQRGLAEQQALLKAGEAITSDLRIDNVIERLVYELRALVKADATACWTLVPDDGTLVCRAVLGLPASDVGRSMAPEGPIGEALGSGKPVSSSDEAGGQVVVAPIPSFGEVRGVLWLSSQEPGRFQESDLRLIEAFASLASNALRNADAYTESTRQAQVERGFYRMSTVLSEPLSAAETLDAVAQAAAEALGGQSAAVLRPVGDELELAGAYELAGGLGEYLRDHAPSLAPCACGGNVLASRRLGDDGRFGAGLAEAAAAADRRSLLAVPIAGGDGLGLVLVFFRDERAFEDEQVELAAQVAAATRGALERSDLYERERRSRSLAQRLASAGRELAGELDPDNVLDGAVRHAVRLLGADAASARVLEDDEVVVRSAVGAGADLALDTRAPSTGWLVGDIVQTRTTRAITDVRTDSRVGEADAMLAAGHAAFLGVPMIGPEEAVHGILAVYGFRTREWREEEVDALHALAASVAAARANAELYQGVSHEQQRSEAILANVADGIVAVDREGKVVLWNPAAERVTGVPAADALGRTPTQALGRPLEAAEGMFDGSRLLPIRRGGDEVWLSLSEAVMTDPAGAVAGRIYAFRDISAERSVEQMKTDFVSTVSHELRTPLTSIYGFAATLLRQDVLFGEEERATFLRYIASESDRLTSIVDRLLSVAQLDTGDMAVQLAQTDIGAVVSEAVRTIEGSGEENGHQFVVDLVDEPLAAEADGDKLGQVLAHLLDNAVRYSPAGGTVTVAARRRDDAVEVSVEDEGVGIPHAEQERIFRKFYRGDGASSGAVGAGATGLGLFLAEGLVLAMGGRIWVDSSEGRGSTFVLELRATESET
ncbi:MAG: GAF domain-containing protein [Actinomycetota bacterium]|nr:GAF domain-containing protein [Actinomycetota bacterium]